MAQLKKRYATALFELSVESGRLEPHLAQAVFIQDVLQSEQAEEFLVHPSIPNSAKRIFLQNLFEKRIDAELMGFLHLAVEKSRETLILPVLQEYMEMAERHQGKVSARVVSAVALRPEQISALQALLSKKLQKQVDVVTQIDPAVLGGLHIHMGNCLIDRTVRTQLQNMKEIIRRGVSNDCKTR